MLVAANRGRRETGATQLSERDHVVSRGLTDTLYWWGVPAAPRLLVVLQVSARVR